MSYYAWKNSRPSDKDHPYSFIYQSLHAVALCFGMQGIRRRIEEGEGNFVKLEFTESPVSIEELKRIGIINETLDKKGNGKKAHKTVTPPHWPSKPSI